MSITSTATTKREEAQRLGTVVGRMRRSRFGVALLAVQAFVLLPRCDGDSDFLDPGGFESGVKMLRALGHDVFVVHITSARDRNPGAFGDVRFVDSETGELREVDVTPRLAAAYVKAWDAHAAELQHFCGRYDIGYVRADADEPFEEVILKAFRQGRFVA